MTILHELLNYHNALLDQRSRQALLAALDVVEAVREDVALCPRTYHGRTWDALAAFDEKLKEVK